MKQLSFFLIVCAASAWGQPTPVLYQPFAQISAYLQLSNTQYQAILSNNAQYYDWTGTKQRRIAQVQTEIAQETAKPTLDAMALGVRYLEVELICRDIKQKNEDTQKLNTGMLTDPQKAKLKALDDAVKLAPVVTDAQNARLVSGSSAVGSFGIGSSIGFLTGVPSSIYGCSSTIFPGNIISAPIIPIGESRSPAESAGR